MYSLVGSRVHDFFIGNTDCAAHIHTVWAKPSGAPLQSIAAVQALKVQPLASPIGSSRMLTCVSCHQLGVTKEPGSFGPCRLAMTLLV